MPRGFEYPVASALPTDLYVPPAFRDEDRVRRDNRNFGRTVIGRLKPGVSIAQASAQMNRVAEALDAEYPDWSKGMRVRIVTLHEHLVGAVRTWMLMLLGAVGLVLLIACANVANLMLARATVRRPEIAVRAALGASRGAIVRGLLVEAVSLSLGGAAIGVLLAWAGVHAMVAWLPASLPRVASVSIDLRVLAAAVAAALATGVGFGLIPALQSSRPNLSATLKDGGRSGPAGAGGQRLRGALVVAEVALAVVLLVGAGLFASSFGRLMRIDPGFDYKRILAVSVGPRWQPGKIEEGFAQAGPYLTRMLEAVSRVPGVQASARGVERRTALGKLEQLDRHDTRTGAVQRTRRGHRASLRHARLPAAARRAAPARPTPVGRRPCEHPACHRDQPGGGPQVLPGPGRRRATADPEPPGTRRRRRRRRHARLRPGSPGAPGRVRAAGTEQGPRGDARDADLRRPARRCCPR